MCYKSLNVRRVCFQGTSGLKVGEETPSKVRYLFCVGAVGITWAK